MVRVNAVGILPIMDMFGRQILFIKIKWDGFSSKIIINGLVEFELLGFVSFTIAFIIVEVSKG